MRWPLTASLDAWSTYTTNDSWTSTPGTNENLPTLGLTCYEAYAFCIWDGGFSTCGSAIEAVSAIRASCTSR